MANINEFNFTTPQDGNLICYNAATQKWINKTIQDIVIEGEPNISTSTTYYINNVTGSDTNDGSQSNPLASFAEAVSRTSNAGSLTAIFEPSATPYDVDISGNYNPQNLPDNFKLLCSSSVVTETDIGTYTNVYDTGTVASAPTVLAPSNPYTYFDVSGLTQSDFNVSGTVLLWTSGARNGTTSRIICKQADGKMMITGSNTNIVNGDTFQIMRPGVLLNLTGSFLSSMGADLVFRFVEVTISRPVSPVGLARINFYFSRIVHTGNSFRPIQGNVFFNDSLITASGSFNTLVANDTYNNNSNLTFLRSVYCQQSGVFNTTANSNGEGSLHINTTYMYFVTASVDLVASNRMRIEMSCIIGSITIRRGTFLLRNSTFIQPSFHPTQRGYTFLSTTGRFENCRYITDYPSPSANGLLFFEQADLFIGGTNTFTLTNSTGPNCDFRGHAKCIFTGTTNFTGTFAECMRIRDNSLVTVGSNGILNSSTATVSAYNINIIDRGSKFVVTGGTLTNFQNGATAVLTDTPSTRDYTATQFAAILSAGSNLVEFEASKTPLDLGLLTTLSADATFSLLHTNIYITAGSSYNLPASASVYPNKLYRVCNSTGGTVTIGVGAAETLRIRDNSGTTVDTINMINGSSTTFIWSGSLYIQFN